MMVSEAKTMGIKKHFNIEITNKKYRNLLLISYGAVAIAAVVVVISGIFLWFNSYTKKIISDMASSQLENIDNVVQANLENYRLQLQNAYQEPSIHSYLFTNNKNFDNEYQIGRYLLNMTVNNGVADYVGLYKKGEVLRAYGAKYPSDDVKSQIEEKISETKDDMEYFLLEENDTSYLYLFFTDRPKIKSAPERGVFYALNIETWKKQLLSEKDDNYSFYIFSEDGKEIISANSNQELSDKIWKALKNNFSTSDGDINIQNKKYIYNSFHDTKNRIYTVILQDFQVEKVKIDEIKNAIYFSMIVSFFLVLLLAFVIANKLYYPVERFFSKLNASMELAAGNDEYSKHQAEITSEKILGQINMLSQQYHSDKVLQYLEEGDYESRIPSVLKLEDRNENCRLILCSAKKRKQGMDLVDTINEFITEKFSGCKVEVFSDVDSTWFMCVLKSPLRLNVLEHSDEVKNKIRELADEKRDYIFAVSSLIVSEKELQKEFQKIRTYVKYQLLDPDVRIIDDVYHENKNTSDISKKNIEDIIAEIRKGNEKGAKEKTGFLLEELKEYQLLKVLWFLADFCVKMKNCVDLTQCNSRQQQESYLNYYMKISSLSDFQDLEEYLEQQIKDSCLEKKVSQERTLRINLVNSIEFIQEHYRDSGISVEYIAERFHISVSYYSRLFKEYTGMTFPEFINDLRLTYARDLLKTNPSLSIKKATEICGFSSVSYFSSQFKKKFGISPSSMKINR